MKKLTLLLAAFALSISLCACVGSPGVSAHDAKPVSAEALVIRDMIGREVSVRPGTYKKVLCIGAGALRMYSYIGDLELLCGVEDIDNPSLSKRPQMFDGIARPYVLAYGDRFAQLPTCGVGGPNAQTAEAEKILACAPDIVISGYEDAERGNALQEQLGIPVITLKTGTDGVFDEAFADSMALLGIVFGAEEKAAALNGFVSAQAAEITRRTAQIREEDKPAVYICGLGSWGTTNHLMTSPDHASLSVANVKNAVGGLRAPGIQAIEAEKFISLGADMDIMIMDAAAVRNIKLLYQEDPTMFEGCRAWESGEVYLQLAFNAYYTNYETALINTWFIAKTVYPHAFADIDMTEKTNEITQYFLGQGLAEEMFAAPASFGGYQKIDTAAFLRTEKEE